MGLQHKNVKSSVVNLKPCSGVERYFLWELKFYRVLQKGLLYPEGKAVGSFTVDFSHLGMLRVWQGVPKKGKHFLRIHTYVRHLEHNKHFLPQVVAEGIVCALLVLLFGRCYINIVV